MNESYVTLQGWVGNDVDLREVGETQCASFHVGCTPRFQRAGQWVDGDTSWFTVNTWRGLARNVADSVRKGDAVVVHGRVKVDVWEREGQPPSVSWVVEATFVGHDLNRGTSSFLRPVRTSAAEHVVDEELRAHLHGFDPSGPRLASDGTEVEAAEEVVTSSP